MRDMTKGMKRDEVMGRDILKADGALSVKRTMMAAGSAGVIIINPGVSLAGRVLLAANKIYSNIGVRFEWWWSAKIQNK